MTIDTKFGIGDDVYAVYKEDDEVKVFKDEITEILITETQTIYYSSIVGWELKEDDLISTADRDKVIDRIDELLKRSEEL